MDKNAIKTYAIWARNELRDRVSKKMDQYEITSDANPSADSVRGKLLSKDEKTQRAKAIMKVKEKGVDQVIEEVAYTWFNRFSALRFMEVNNYLPTRIRVFTEENNEFRPQILSEAIHMELDGLDMEKVYELKEKNDSDELFKYLIITQCNALSKILPGMFQKIADYTELLFPDNLLREGSVIEQLIKMIPEDNWTDQVQIIGWLYEAYNTERNEMVYDGTLSKAKISKELLPAATTIFTPDWPVHYMVENSLGRLWLEGHPNGELQSKWKYYLDDVEQEPEVQTKLDRIKKDYAGIKPEDIIVIDPCQGSGHILCVLFDTLMSIYESFGYSVRDSVRNIVEKNLWGLDIDDRAAQLAYFSVMMKARQYDSRFLVRKGEDGRPDIPQPHIYGIVESNALEFAGNYGDLLLGDEHLITLKYLLDKFKDAKEYGSILDVEARDYEGFLKAWKKTSEHALNDISLMGWYMDVESSVTSLAYQAIALSQQYHVVVTNPPYLGNTRFSPALDKMVKDNYADVKSDLSMVMYKHAVDSLVKRNGFVSFITTSSWMFLASFEKLRDFLEGNVSYSSLVDFGTELFEGKVGHNPIVAWTIRKTISHCKMTAIRLVEYCYSRRDEKEGEFFQARNRYYIDQEEFNKVPGKPITYWVKNFDIFEQEQLGNYIDARIGMVSGDNDRFLRFWHEVDYNHIEYEATPGNDPQKKKWYPLQKGGEYKLWYGNLQYIIDWENDGYSLKYDNYMGKRVRSHNYNGVQQFKEGITWNSITSGKFHCRYSPLGFTYDAAGPLCEVTKPGMLYIVLAMLSSKVATYLFSLINPTINFPSGYLEALPFIMPEDKEYVEKLAKESVNIAKLDWDSFEISWDFASDPIVKKALNRSNNSSEGAVTIENVYKHVTNEFEESFKQLKENEEELNRIFIDIYGLQNELTPQVEDKDVTVRCPDRERDIKNFISYAVGCMMGRYNCGGSGLEYAGGTWDASKYKYFPADADGILPICDDEYFEDDIVGRFVDFVKEVFGADTLEDNLKYISDSLGGSGAPREVIRSYFLNGFYADHLKMYQKRPIYWLFDSGKKNGFKCLVYMHRYKPDTIARIRTDYVHEQQSRYRTAIAGLERQIADASTSERVRLDKRLSTMKEQAEEIRKYEEKIHHLADQMISINLDDGVKHNYEIFEDVLARIK